MCLSRPQNVEVLVKDTYCTLITSQRTCLPPTKWLMCASRCGSHCAFTDFILLLVAGVAKLVFVLYKHLGQFLSTENATLRGMGDLSKHNLSLTVNSHILSASITKESSRVFVADPVIFTLEHLDVSLLPRHPSDGTDARGC